MYYMKYKDYKKINIIAIIICVIIRFFKGNTFLNNYFNHQD